MDIAAQTFDLQETTKFATIVSVLYKLKHDNLVSFVGFCDENGRQIIVNKHEYHECLDKHLSNYSSLNWMRRLRVCYGVANALKYIHYDKGHDVSVIHCNIKSCNIYLDDKWEPKLSGLVHSLKIPVSKRHLAIHADQVLGTTRYMDPTYEKTKRVTQKSDVFSLGVLLFEVLCGDEVNVNSDNAFLAQLAKSPCDIIKGEALRPIIDHDLLGTMSPESLHIFKETAYWCLKEQRTHRPHMGQVVNRLDNALQLQWKWDNEARSPTTTEVTSFNRLKEKNLAHLEIQLRVIAAATENFAKKYIIGEGGYGKVYKAVLEHFDDTCSLPAEEMVRGNSPKRRSTVAIKHIMNREDLQGEQGFIAEIEMLTSCKHKNVISLLGFCNEGPDQQILVYEHASNGSLSDCLQSMVRMANITWVQRIKICLDIAHGLNYLHTSMEEKQMIVHRDIKSDNILLDKDLNAKIADFGLSKFHPMGQQVSTLFVSKIAGTEVYLDPEYKNTNKLKTVSDVYSFGVVLFEILCGKVAYHTSYLAQNEKGLGPIARKSVEDNTINEMIDCNLKRDIDEIFSTQNRGLNATSVEVFTKIAFECLSETQFNRPTMEVIIKELEQALSFQENNKNTLKISHDDLKLATQNFAHEVGLGEYWSLYKGEVEDASGQRTPVVAKWLGDKLHLDHEFLTELQTLFELKHENIISLEGYCNDGSERIIVYRHASNGCLKRHLKDSNLTWMKRLKICIDVASGLDFLHGTHEVIIHRDLNSSSILLTGDWKAQIANFGRRFLSLRDDEIGFEMDDSQDIFHYIDPVFHQEGNLTRESDIYSLGLVLFEILCGELVVDYNDEQYLPKLVKDQYVNDKIDEMVFEGIKIQIAPHSLTTFQRIAYQCLHDKRENRPMASEVLVQLKKALEFQEDFEIWAPKLPADYKEILKKSKTPIVYSEDNKRDIYMTLSKGILLKKGNMQFSLGSNAERKEMIRARTFLDKKCIRYKSRSIPESRFSNVAEVLEISNMKIPITINTKFLTKDVNYKVHLIFKFCDQSKSQAKRMYVNLSYQKEDENLHTYFATWGDDDWMMIELAPFFNSVEHTIIEYLLEGFSQCYCPSRAIYIEGIEFQAIDNVRHEVINNSINAQEGMKSYSVTDKLLFWRSRAALIPMLSAKDVIYKSKWRLLNLKSQNTSRSQEVIELSRKPPQQFFNIKCKIKSRLLSSNTEYACYLVFKLPKDCRGLDSPVIVRDILHWKNKEAGILYFRSPNQLNQHQLSRVPLERQDGQMEVNVWRFNSTNDLRNDYLPMHLKLTIYEGTMSGLIICGLEFRRI